MKLEKNFVISVLWMREYYEVPICIGGRIMRKDYVKFHFRSAYRKCESCYNFPGLNKEKKSDFYQRMDEILLIYSNIFDVSVNDARKELSDVNVGEGVA